MKYASRKIASILVVSSFVAAMGCDSEPNNTTTSGSSGDVTSSSSGMGTGGMGTGGMGTGGMGTGGMGTGGMGTGGMGTGGMGTGGMGTGGMGTGGMGTGGMMGGNFSIDIIDDATFIDCSKTGADQLGGTAFVSFQNDTGATQAATLTKSTMNFVNGANTMDMTLNMQWSMSNPGPANQISTGTTPSVIYKAQPGAPAPPKNPCDFCPFMGGNGNTQPKLSLTLEWNVNGQTITDVTTPELKSCL